MSATKQARLILGMAFLLNLFGTCGVLSGVSNVRSLPSAASVRAPDGSGPPVSELTEDERLQELEASGAALQEAIDPYRRQFAAANILVSLMLVAGSWMLVRRRSSSLWWIRQAIAANVLWVVAQTTGVLVTLYRNAAEVLPLATAFMDTQLAALGLPQEARDAGIPLVTSFTIAAVLTALVKILAFVAVGWGAHRPAIREYMARGPSAGADG